MPLLNTVGTQYGTHTISPANDKGPRNNNRPPFLNKNLKKRNGILNERQSKIGRIKWILLYTIAVSVMAANRKRKREEEEEGGKKEKKRKSAISIWGPPTVMCLAGNKEIRKRYLLVTLTQGPRRDPGRQHTHTHTQQGEKTT
jgi:hypothetical protein